MQVSVELAGRQLECSMATLTQLAWPLNTRSSLSPPSFALNKPVYLGDSAKRHLLPSPYTTAQDTSTPIIDFKMHPNSLGSCIMQRAACYETLDEAVAFSLLSSDPHVRPTKIVISCPPRHLFRIFLRPVDVLTLYVRYTTTTVSSSSSILPGMTKQCTHQNAVLASWTLRSSARSWTKKSSQHISKKRLSIIPQIATTARTKHALYPSTLESSRINYYVQTLLDQDVHPLCIHKPHRTMSQ